MYNDITYKDILDSLFISIIIIIGFGINLALTNNLCEIFGIDGSFSYTFALPGFSISLAIIFTFFESIIIYKVIKKQ